MYTHSIGSIPDYGNISNNSFILSNENYQNKYKIHTKHLKDGEKLNICWESSEHPFESKNESKKIKGINNFISNDENSNENDSNFGEIEPKNGSKKINEVDNFIPNDESSSEDDFSFGGDESTDDITATAIYKSSNEIESENIEAKLENIDIKNKKTFEDEEMKSEDKEIESEDKEIESEDKEIESENEETKISTQNAKTREKVETQSLKNHLEKKFAKLGVVYRSRAEFEEDVKKLQEKIANEPSRAEELTQKFTDKAINRNKVGRSVQGEFVPLNEEEKETLRRELKDFFKGYLARYPILTQQKQPEEKRNEQPTHHAKWVKDKDNYTMAVYSPNYRVFSGECQVETTEKSKVIAELIILAEMIKYKQEEDSEEKKTEEKGELYMRILEAVIKYETLKSETLSSEIKLQQIKFEINNTVDIPTYTSIKLIKTIENSNQSIVETIPKQLPGLHEVKSLTTSTIA